jgi:glycosyltransferase involved in cell wall biosynthesis
MELYVKSIKFLQILLFFFINIIYKETKLFIKVSYKHFVRDCFNLKKYNRKSVKVEFPYLSICIPSYNMKSYIRKVVISILNQTFQNFEIIIVNDHSNDTTLAEIKKLQLEDNRIKLINHSKNLGVYNSRVDAIISSKGKYFILIDPDDIFVNPNLFQELYNYNLKYNLDIIEYTVICHVEKKNIIKIIERYYHFHNFSKTIISQPELDDIYYYWNSTSKVLSKVGCRVIWNKIIRRKALMKSIEYIGKTYYKNFFVTAEDTIINLISFHFAKNYSNIKIPGYMYNIREKSMTRGNRTINNEILFCYNHLLYFRKFYVFIKNFNKKRYILFSELLDLNKRITMLNYLTKNKMQEILIFYHEILNDKYAFSQFKRVVKIFSLEIKK